MTTALIVVDLQNDFGNPEGSLFCPGGEELAEGINHLLAEDWDYRVFTRDFHPPETPHFQEYGGSWPPHCIGGTWGAEYVDDLNTNEWLDKETSYEVLKGGGGADGYSAFSVRDENGTQKATDLHDWLMGREVTDITVVGIATDVCVRETCIDGLRNQYKVHLLSHLCAPVTPEGEKVALRDLKELGVDVH